MPVLEDLANDPNFQGSVICELNPAHWDGEYPFTRKLPEAMAFTHPEVSGAYLETLLGEQFRERTSFFSYNLFTEGPRILQHKPIPEPEQADRFVRFHDLGPTINEPLIDSWVRAALESAERISRHRIRANHARSGAMGRANPAAGWRRGVRADAGGRAICAWWRTRFSANRRVSSATFGRGGMLVIDFAEMPGHFRCPDGSHLEASEADRFSAAGG